MIHFAGIVLALLPAYLIRFRIFNIPTTLLEVLVVVFLAAAAATRFREIPAAVKKLGAINGAAVLFILAGIIATAVSPEKTKALGELKAFIIEPILFFYATIIVVRTEAQKRIILRWLLASAAVVSLFGIVQYFTFLHLPLRFWGTGLEPERITSVFDYPNALSLYLAPLFIFFFTLWVRRFEFISRKWLTSALLLMTLALLLTFSRGAWVAVMVGILALGIRHLKWKQSTLITLILLVIGVLPPVFNRAKVSFSDPSSQAHLDLMKVGVNKIISSPFLGNGLYGFRTTLEKANFQGEILNYPHNIFLNFWLELGLLGLIAFGLTVFLASQQQKKHPTALTAAAGMFLAVMIIHGLVDVPYFKNDLSILFWFMIALFYIVPMKAVDPR